MVWQDKYEVMGDAHKMKKEEQFENILCVLTVSLIPLHLYLSLINVIYGIDKGYGHSFPLRSFILIGIYLSIILLLDVFMLRKFKFTFSIGLRRYWASAGIVSIIFLILIATAMPEGGFSMIAIPFLAYTPFIVLLPLLEILGLDETIPCYIAISGFCLLNWVISMYSAKKE